MFTLWVVPSPASGENICPNKRNFITSVTVFVCVIGPRDTSQYVATAKFSRERIVILSLTFIDCNQCFIETKPELESCPWWWNINCISLPTPCPCPCHSKPAVLLTTHTSPSEIVILFPYPPYFQVHELASCPSSPEPAPDCDKLLPNQNQNISSLLTGDVGIVVAVPPDQGWSILSVFNKLPVKNNTKPLFTWWSTCLNNFKLGLEPCSLLSVAKPIQYCFPKFNSAAFCISISIIFPFAL